MNGNPVGEARRSVMTRAVPATASQQTPSVLLGQPGLVAERERGSDLDSGATRFEDLLQSLGRGGTAGHPERESQLPDLFEIDHVLLAVDRFVTLVDLERAAWRRIVAAGGRTFDDESVDLAVGPPKHGHREDVGRDDREESGAGEGWVIALHEIPRVKPCEGVVTGF